MAYNYQTGAAPFPGGGPGGPPRGPPGGGVPFPGYQGPPQGVPGYGPQRGPMPPHMQGAYAMPG